MTVKIRQGDSYVIYIELKNSGVPLTPGIVTDVEVCIGDFFHKTYGNGVGYDDVTQRWYIRPTQQETAAFEPGGYDVEVRIKYTNDVKGAIAGKIIVSPMRSREVL